MKWLLAIGLVIILTTTGSFPYGENASASDRTAMIADKQVVVVPQQKSKTHVLDFLKPDPNRETGIMEEMFLAEQDRLLAKAEIERELQLNTAKIQSVVGQLKSRVGKTWYVFSGHTPRGWDCSGLVYWAYEQLGVSVEHSANKQGNSGTKVRTPKIGDIVVFGYKGSKSYYHSSIYIGDGKVIHAGFRKGTSTSVIALDDPSFKDSTITFVRLIESN
jgi:cell wall-associated NlpC family hydrolase